jgi:hypothetical protein
MPEGLYLINNADATLDGSDLGDPEPAAQAPDIGGVTLPARGVLAIGQRRGRSLSPAEYHRTRTATELSLG